MRRARLALLVVAAAASAQAPAPEMGRFQQLRATPLDDPATRATLERGQLRNPPYYLYELARRTLSADPAAARMWFIVAAVRVRYHALRCTDRTAAADVGTMGQLAAEVARTMADAAAREQAIAAAGARADLFDGTFPPAWICAHGLEAMQAGLAGRPLDPAKVVRPAGEWPALQAKLRTELASGSR